MKLSSSITVIGKWAFAATGIKEISLHYGITSIGDSAFCNCHQLESVILPATITSIGNSSFYNCEKLESFTIQAAVPPTLGIQAFLGSTDTLEIYVPGGTLSTYRAAAGWIEHADLIDSYA